MKASNATSKPFAGVDFGSLDPFSETDLSSGGNTKS
jgi:hypothetical protein